MAVKAERVTEANPLVRKGAETTGISVLFIPDETFLGLSNAAAERNLTVSQLIAAALSAFLGEKPEDKQPSPTQEPVKTKARSLKGYR